MLLYKILNKIVKLLLRVDNIVGFENNKKNYPKFNRFYFKKQFDSIL